MPHCYSGQVLSTPIVIDSFTRGTGGFRVFFLSHIHSDHTNGLRDGWELGNIVCSCLTRRLLLSKFKIDPKLVIGVPLDTPTCFWLDKLEKESMQVTLHDANHCPGAVVFCFEGYFGTLIHTGDFRWDPSFAVLPKNADHLFLDNSFCHPRYVFPPRKSAVKRCLKFVKRKRGNKILLGLDSIGKEELLVALVDELRCTAIVPRQRYSFMRAIAEFSPASDVARIFPALSPYDGEHFRFDGAGIKVVPRTLLSYKMLNRHHASEPSIGILPTGWTALGRRYKLHRSGSAHESASTAPDVGTYEDYFISKGSPEMLSVCYSLHSSYPELKASLQTLQPRQVTASSDLSAGALMELSSLFRECCRSKKRTRPIQIPPSVQEAMKPDLPPMFERWMGKKKRVVVEALTVFEEEEEEEEKFVAEEGSWSGVRCWHLAKTLTLRLKRTRDPRT